MKAAPGKRRARVWKTLVPYLLAALSLAVAGALYVRVRAFDERHGCDVLAGLSPLELRQRQKTTPPGMAARPNGATASGQRKTDETESPKKAASLSVARVEYDGDKCISVVLSERPDMDVVRNYVKVGPLIDGAVGFSYVTRRNEDDVFEPIVRITGNYAYRTNVTLHILRGFPRYGKGVNPQAEGSLAEDFVRVFRRKDPAPSVAYADNGRYLPPGGRNALRIEAIGVTNVATEIRRVEPRNVVQMLAREERQYEWYSWGEVAADGEATAELSGACETGLVRCLNRPLEKESLLLPVALKDGGPARGIFLVTVRSADRAREDSRWARNPNPNVYRLVCLSDLGLSVRDGKGCPGVWVTSFTTGRPVAGARVEVYSSANVLLADGSTDANGWCATKRRAKGTAFAVVAWTDSDRTFMALRDSMKVDETDEDGARPGYLTARDVDAFVWTERGIYRHGERIFAQALVRDGSRKAPMPLPLRLVLLNPKGEAFASRTLVSDANGSLACDQFSVPAEQPSGKWTVQVRLPGKEGAVLAEREIKVEEFAPPQIRVNVRTDESRHPTNFIFTVSAEHLFGGPACALACEGAVVFEDVPFAPKGWKGFTFGNEERGLRPSFRRLSQRVLDDRGACVFAAPLEADSGRPKAAVRATGQGVVFEDGGRPATARKSVVCHYYPFYIGSTLSGWLRLPKSAPAKIEFVCVDPNGALLAKPRRLVGKIERIDSVYSCRKDWYGHTTWNCDRVRTTLLERIPIPVGEGGRATYELPLKECGDYVLTVEDPETGASFGRTFYLSDWGDEAVRAPLSNPTEVTLRADKSFYRVGERPRLVVKSPFAGYAILSVLRDDRVYDEVVNLTNATSEVVLRPVERAWAPNVDVALSVVQSVAANAKHLAARAHGRTTIRVRPIEDEIDVRLNAEVKVGGVSRGERPEAKDETGARVTVEVEALGATSVVVTLVDEGINLLTGEPVPDPVGWFSRPRDGGLALFDLYGWILPVADDGLRAGGVKTGGGFGAEMLGRVSPVPTRRFRPLALWRSDVALRDGKCRVVFDLPEFVGEVRVTAVAHSATATGAASVWKKVAPKLVLQPDAPRFVAPGDAFDVTMPLRNCGRESGEVRYSIGTETSGCAQTGKFVLPKGSVTNVVCRMTAPTRPGEVAIRFQADGLGESHRAVLAVPVRPAVAWRERAEVIRLDPGQSLRRSVAEDCQRFLVTVGGSRMTELASALEWLADYPHGCLEQTASRVFPLIAAGGVLASVGSAASSNRADCVAAGVRRVESMVRENDFVMWPDCSCAPWDREVSLYAAHFLFEAEKGGGKLNPQAKKRVLKFLKRWAMSTNACTSAYACHTLALANAPEKDRMLCLYDARAGLDFLSRARLSRAFAAIHDRPRAEELMKGALEPQSVKEAAFRTLALVDLDPDDGRIPGLIAYLTDRRDRQRFVWGTTGENAHALLAIAAYYAHHPVKEGAVRVGRLGTGESAIVDGANLALTNTGPATAFLSIRTRWLNDPQSETNEANGIFVTRRYLRPDGTPADLDRLVRGEMLVAELTVTSDVTRVIGDLVVEDLFAGAFEPVHRELDPGAFGAATATPRVADWVMRKDARDDRMLVFSKAFRLEKGYEAKVCYPVRVVSTGDFVLPGPSVEGMYNPSLHARRAPGRLVVRH